MRAEKQIAVWIILSNPDHYHSTNGSCATFKQRISSEMDRLKARLLHCLAIKPHLKTRFVHCHELLDLSHQSAIKPDVVLFLMESRNFEDGIYNPPMQEHELKGYLKSCGIPYTGCDGLSLFSDYDKSLQYALALACGIAVPEQRFIAPESDPSTIAWDHFPAFVKPCMHGDSIGIRHSSMVQNRQEMLIEINRQQQVFPNEPLVIQEFLDGNEYTVGVMGNWNSETCTVLPIIQIGFDQTDLKIPVLTHDAKNTPQSEDYMQDHYHIAQLSPELECRLSRDTLAIYKHLKCHGYARADWRLDRQGTPKFLEINALPDIMDDTSSLIKMYRHRTGGDHGDFLADIITYAMERH